MGIYRKIEVAMWGDVKVRALSRPPPCGQVLWFHLLAGEQTDIIPGLAKIGEAAFAEQLGWTVEGFREAFREVYREGLARADWKARVVWVPKAIKHNPPQSLNVVKSWAPAWERIPECPLKLEVWQELGAFLEGMPEAFREAYAKACPKPCAIQEQEQEQDHYKRSRACARAMGAATTPSRPADGLERDRDEGQHGRAEAEAGERGQSEISRFLELLAMELGMLSPVRLPPPGLAAELRSHVLRLGGAESAARLTAAVYGARGHLPRTPVHVASVIRDVKPRPAPRPPPFPEGLAVPDRLRFVEERARLVPDCPRDAPLSVRGWDDHGTYRPSPDLVELIERWSKVAPPEVPP